MPDASVKEKIMVMEASPASSRLSGKTGETGLNVVAGKPDSLLAQKRAESLQWKTVKYCVGAVTAKQFRANKILNCFPGVKFNR